MTANHEVLLHGRHYATGAAVAIRIIGGRIVAMKPLPSTQTSLWIGPGLVDLQVNGYGGWDFNASCLTAQAVCHATNALWTQGITGYLPTIITASDGAVEQALDTIAEAVSQTPAISNTIRGVHLEGPFISPIDGPRGAHEGHWVKAPDWDLFRKWQHLARGLIKVITLSPEWEEAPGFIRQCVSSGVKVAIGHTAANSEQIARAVEAGGSLSTHLGNGCHPVMARHPNYLWDQLADDRLWASIIVDGFHLPDSVIKVILQVKRQKTLLISDSVSLSGLAPGTYRAPIGGEVTLTREGKLQVTDHPELLAGSVQSIARSIDYLAARELCTFETAWNMASIQPCAYMGFPGLAGLSSGAPADIVVFRRDGGTSEIQQVYSAGALVYDNL